MKPPSAIANDTQELIVLLHRRNGDPARLLAARVQADLKLILTSDLAEASALRRQVQQTMYAIEEVLELIDGGDLRGAWEAARDASKECRVIAQAQD